MKVVQNQMNQLMDDLTQNENMLRRMAADLVYRSDAGQWPEHAVFPKVVEHIQQQISYPLTKTEIISLVRRHVEYHALINFSREHAIRVENTE